jgi:hypothetical protein
MVAGSKASGFIQRMMWETKHKHDGKYKLPTGPLAKDSKMNAPAVFSYRKVANKDQGGVNEDDYGASPFIIKHFGPAAKASVEAALNQKLALKKAAKAKAAAAEEVPTDKKAAVAASWGVKAGLLTPEQAYKDMLDEAARKKEEASLKMPKWLPSTPKDRAAFKAEEKKRIDDYDTTHPPLIPKKYKGAPEAWEIGRRVRDSWAVRNKLVSPDDAFEAMLAQASPKIKKELTSYASFAAPAASAAPKAAEAPKSSKKAYKAKPYTGDMLDELDAALAEEEAPKKGAPIPPEKLAEVLRSPAWKSGIYDTPEEVYAEMLASKASKAAQRAAKKK